MSASNSDVRDVLLPTGFCGRLSLFSPKQCLLVCSVTLFLMMGLTTLCGVEVSHWSVVPAPSRVALQPEGSMAAGALPVLWHVAV